MTALTDYLDGGQIKPEDLPRLLGDLERLKAELWARLVEAAQTPLSDDSPLLDVDQAAEFLNIHPSYVYDLANRGKLPSRKVGKYRRFRRSELIAWLDAVALDNEPCVTHSPSRDGGRGAAAPKAARAHPSPARSAPRRDGKQRSPVGAGRDGDTGVGGPAASSSRGTAPGGQAA
jgi:excisionase family DNA binding protein